MIGKTLIAGFIGTMLLAAVPGMAEKAPVIPGSKETFPVSPSPWEDRLLLYSLKQEVEGETAIHVPGPLVSLSKNGDAWRVREIRSLMADMDTGSVVWAKGSAYVTSAKGIFRLRTQGLPQKIYAGKPTGLAVSGDGATLAFWLSSGKRDVLVAIRVSDGRVLRRWSRPFNLRTETSGWELVFTPDGRSILARTYDEEDSVHLKAFDLHTASMTSLLEDCYSLVQSGDSIFILSGEGESRSLYRFSGGKLELLEHVGDLHSLTPTAHSNQVVLTNAFKQHLLVYDTDKHVMQEVNGCTDATVLKSGQQIFFRDGKIYLDPGSCPPVNASTTEDILRYAQGQASEYGGKARTTLK